MNKLRLYNNKYCADYDGVVNNINWQVTTKCLASMNGKTSPMDAIYQAINMRSLIVLTPKSTTDVFCPTLTFCGILDYIGGIATDFHTLDYSNLKVLLR